VSRRATLIAAAAPFFVIENIDFVHTGFLTAALMGLSLAFIERRPWISGIFLGLLTYKPQFGLLFPVALLASRNWRALGSATASTVVLGVTAAIAFGYAGWASPSMASVIVLPAWARVRRARLGFFHYLDSFIGRARAHGCHGACSWSYPLH
jgi:hypothetical protein